jgi:hypothetical protein
LTFKLSCRQQLFPTTGSVTDIGLLLELVTLMVRSDNSAPLNEETVKGDDAAVPVAETFGTELVRLDSVVVG